MTGLPFLRRTALSANESTASYLGYGGLIPFAVFSIGSWTGLPYVDDSSAILIAYAAVIMSFMGAIYWGLGMAKTEESHAKNLFVSVLPALAAWFALLVTELYALIILSAGFIFLLAYDLAIAQSLALPDWYISLRIKLTLAVSVCLAVTLISVIVDLQVLSIL